MNDFADQRIAVANLAAIAIELPVSQLGVSAEDIPPAIAVSGANARELLIDSRKRGLQCNTLGLSILLRAVAWSFCVEGAQIGAVFLEAGPDLDARA